MQDTFSKSCVEGLITRYGQIDAVLRDINGEDVWVLEDGVTIRLPNNYSRIDLAKVQLIAEVKLQMHPWEFDYWLGQQKSDIN